MPVVRRLFLAIFGLLCGFLFCVWGSEHFDYKRRLLGPALIGCG
jgi:hypothetical protein